MTSATTTFHFPPHPHPRTWLITSATSPIGLSLAHALLSHGDHVVLGIPPSLLERKNYAYGGSEENSRAEDVGKFLKETVPHEGWKERVRVVGLDGRSVGQCQAAIAEAVEAYGKVDILFCCASEAVVGTVEELSASDRTLTLVRDQFESNFFGPVNIIKACLPAMREKKSGHIIALTGITGHLGTPGLGMYCSSGWALEGFCDSLAYEVAPFNIKITIVQPNLEINILTNKITSAPLLPEYSSETHPAPLARMLFGGLLDQIEGKPSSSEEDDNAHGPIHLSSTQIESLHPNLPSVMVSSFIAETIHALTAIGGHENPPARHIVGFEGVASVKEKLKTVSEELEDFVEVSGAVDIEMQSDGIMERRVDVNHN